MKFRIVIITLMFLLTAPFAWAGEPDYLALLAEESEIKAIAVVTKVQRMSRNSDGTFMHVTFRRQYAVTPYTAKEFVAGCKTMESGWQKRAEGTVYFKPIKGQKVFVTITTNGGAITSYTPLTPQLEAVIKSEPHRLAYSKGLVSIIPTDE